MTHQKKIMILGAGTNQLDLIQTAVRHGCYVVTVDNVPENIGHTVSHQSVNCSTLDRESVLHWARKLKIDGICTASSDIAVPTLGYVASHLGLPGIPLTVADTITDKRRFRAHQQRCRLSHPAFFAGDRFADIRESIQRLAPPLIFKPVDSSGSRGIVRVGKPDPESCLAAFTTARSFSKSGTVCIEEFMEGTEVGGDAFLIDGRIAFCAITQKYLKGFTPIGHRLPTHISRVDQQRVIRELQSTCDAVGYAEGPLNFDVMVSPSRVTVIEMGARSGGNGIVSLITHAMAFDLHDAVLQQALGKRIVIPVPQGRMLGCGSLIFGAPGDGILKHIASAKAIRDAVPEIYEYIVDVAPGDRVYGFTHSGRQIGRALFACRDQAEYRMRVQKVSAALRMSVFTGETGSE